MQILSRRAALALPILWAAVGATAQPGRPVRVIVPSAAGATPDTTMRVLTQEITRQTGIAFVVENKPGASGVLGMTDLVRQPPDGLTIAWVNNVTLAINRSTFTKLPYDPASLVPVTLITKVANVIVVRPQLPAHDMKGMLAYAKAHPDQLAYASPGQGTSGHLSGELLAMKTGVQIKHIPYRGSPQAITDLLGGHFDMMIDNLPNVLPYIRQGKLRAIAVTSLTRNPQVPDVPTVAESGFPGFEGIAWGGVAMPPGTPAAAARQMNAVFVKAVEAPDVKRYFQDVGSEITVTSDPSALTRYAESETAKWAAVIKQAGIQPQ